MNTVSTYPMSVKLPMLPSLSSHYPNKAAPTPDDAAAAAAGLFCSLIFISFSFLPCNQMFFKMHVLFIAYRKGGDVDLTDMVGGNVGRL